MWREPELAYQERRAHDALCSFFAAAGGWEGDASLPPGHGVQGRLGAPAGGLAVGDLCEYDALPEIGRACGHHLFAEVGAATALGLKAALETIPDLKVKVELEFMKTAFYNVFPNETL